MVLQDATVQPELTSIDTPEEIPDAVRDEIEKVVKNTKKNFDLKERLKGRGLRRATLTLYLDEDKGPELGWAFDEADQFGNRTGRRVREGVLGDLDRAVTTREKMVEEHAVAKAAWEATSANTLDGVDGVEPMPLPELDLTDIDEEVKELEAKRDELVAALTGTGLTVSLCAVPPVIQKDTRRRAKQTLGITSKVIPDDRTDLFLTCQSAHMITVLVKSITDNATGEMNVGLDYDDAIALMDYLPVGQLQRLNEAISILQFTDAISRDIEGQEDFS